MRTTRGEIWLADYGEPVGREQGYPRPAVILSGPMLPTERMGLSVTLPLTSRRRNWPSHVEISPGESGLRERSWAMVEQIRSISTLRLSHRLGRIAGPELSSISQVLSDILET
jgi:mRNA interferase MazF